MRGFCICTGYPRAPGQRRRPPPCSPTGNIKTSKTFKINYNDTLAVCFSNYSDTGKRTFVVGEDVLFMAPDAHWHCATVDSFVGTNFVRVVLHKSKRLASVCRANLFPFDVSKVDFRWIQPANQKRLATVFDAIPTNRNAAQDLWHQALLLKAELGEAGLGTTFECKLTILHALWRLYKCTNFVGANSKFKSAVLSQLYPRFLTQVFKLVGSRNQARDGSIFQPTLNLIHAVGGWEQKQDIGRAYISIF